MNRVKKAFFGFIIFGLMLAPAGAMDSLPFDISAHGTAAFHDIYSTDSFGTILGGLRVGVEVEVDVYLNDFFGSGIRGSFRSFPPFSINGSEEIVLFPEYGLRSLLIGRLGPVKAIGFAGILYGWGSPNKIEFFDDLVDITDTFLYEFGAGISLGWLYGEYVFLLPFDTTQIISHRYTVGIQLSLASLLGG